MLPKEAEVVVVGGGPTGLVLTSILRQAGHDVLALDRQAEGANDSRAAAIHAKTLEVLGELNVTDRLVAEGVIVPTFTFRDRDRILTRLDFSALPTPYPFVLTLQQYRTEKILTERMHALGGEVMRPYSVTGVSIDGDAADVDVEGPDGREVVRARYVVGADGVGSVVRQSAKIAYAGGTYDQSFTLADARVEWPLPFEEVQNFFSPAGIVVSGPLPDNQRRVLATVDSARDVMDREPLQITLCKCADTFCPLGPHIVTADEVPDVNTHPLELSTRVNGVYKQRTTTDTMIYSIPTLLEFLTRTVTLQPGDLMSSGTAGGTGVGRTPQEFLLPGDTVTVATTGIGYLSNPVVARWPQHMRSPGHD